MSGWQDSLRFIQEQFQHVQPPARNLWYGKVIEVTPGFPASWETIRARVPVARNPHVKAYTYPRESPFDVERGRLFGSEEGLGIFEPQADAAFRALEQGPFEDLLSAIRPAAHPM